MAEFLKQNQISFWRLKDFLVKNAEKINRHSKAMAAEHGRPFQYLNAPTRKEDLARKMAEDEGIQRGLICGFSVLEPCRTFSFRYEKGRPRVRGARRKCLFIYFCLMDQKFGLIRAKLQTWFPTQIQVYVNGHDWLERKLTANGISFTKHDNVFLRVDDWKRAQKLADRFTGLNWPRILERYARCVNPLLKDLLRGYQHYWVTSQSEYSTDIVFKSSSDLRELFPHLPSHSTLCFGVRDAMSFLGRKLTGYFLGEIISDMKDGSLPGRIPGARVKHRIKENWLKMYDKAGSVLRIEMVINNLKGQSAKVSRILSRFHVHQLIAKIPHSRRWRVTDHGNQIMAVSLCLRDVAFPELFRKNIAV